MGDSNSYDAIGVDGGGTSCRIALIIDGRSMRVKVGDANVTSDFEGAVRTISQGLAEVAAKAGISVETLADFPAYLGLAGVLDDATALRVARALPLTRARVADDRVSTLTGALGGADGTVAGIGTGSFLARQIGEDVKLIGGYGFRLGDEASGAWMGRALLRRCLHVLDGIAPATTLTQTVLEEFEGQASVIVRFASIATPKDFGTFAERIMTAATNGDATALGIVERGADYIVAALSGLGWASGENFCLTGGVGPHFAEFLPEDISDSLIEPKGTGLDGAVLLAQRLARESAGDPV